MTAANDIECSTLTHEEQAAWQYELWSRAVTVKRLEEELARPDYQDRASVNDVKPYRYIAARVSAATIARDAVAAEFDRLLDRGKVAAWYRGEE